MYAEGCHPVYPYSAKEKLAAQLAVGLTESIVQTSVDAVLEWFLKQPHLVPAGIIDRETVERMLLMAKGSVEKTKQRIDGMHKYRGLLPEMMQNRERELDASPGSKWDNFLFSPIPKLYEGKRITVVRLCISNDPSRFSLEAIFRVAAMAGDIRLHSDYMSSDIWILDFNNFTPNHLLRLNPVLLKKTALLFHEGFSFRMSAIHAYNCLATSYAQNLLAFLRQFFRGQMIDRVVINDKVEDLLKHVPKECLPQDLGGDQPSMQDLNDAFQRELNNSKTKQFLLEKSKMVSDESKRPGGETNEEFLAGSFRMLDFD